MEYSCLPELLFRPFLAYLDGGARMPLRAIVGTLAVMWTAVSVSSALLIAHDDPWIAAIVVAAGIVGSVFVLRLRSAGTGSAPSS